MYNIRVAGKYAKASILWFFTKNRKLKLSIRGLCWVLIATAVIGWIGGRELGRWAYPDAYVIRFLVTRSEEIKTHLIDEVEASTAKDVRTKESSVQDGGESQELGHSPSIEDKIRSVFGEEGDIAVAIAMCESRLDPSRYGDTHLSRPSIGVFQISQIYHDYTDEELLDEDNNIRIAKEIRDKGGWNRWTCYRDDIYKQFM